ncbi:MULTISPECIES: hypothetical protein [Metallosphaera]|nr:MULTISPECIES: hypothetical protein [Metallosphaera]WPX07346.1 hypothetical protein SOJ17_001108 [Metallosphaera sedula DSM 5348]
MKIFYLRYSHVIKKGKPRVEYLCRSCGKLEGTLPRLGLREGRLRL